MHTGDKNVALRRALINCARGDAPADLVLKNARVVHVFSGDTDTCDVAILGDRIAGLGSYRGRRKIDIRGRFLCPGFIEGHIHIESSMLTPRRFAEAVLPRGTTTVIADPHEIANVLGMEGIRFMLSDGETTPLEILAMAPSCVPATHLESAGAALEADDLARLLKEPSVPGLAEMMNFPGTVAAQDDVLAKLQVFLAAHRPVDGHAPGLSGAGLQAYCAAGISSDHECTTLAEAREKLRAGMYIYIREGSTARNLEALLPLVTPYTARRCLLVSDDLHADDILTEGHLDRILRRAVSLGLDPVMALQMVTINPARRFGLAWQGAVAPGYRADLVVLEDLQDFQVQRVFKDGRQVAAHGRPEPAGSGPADGRDQAPVLHSSLHIDWSRVNLRVAARAGRIRVIRSIEHQIVTGQLFLDPTVADGEVVADPGRDLLKIAVIERHHASGRTGVGFIRGFGLDRGALASTVAHDSHNLIVVGATDRAMLRAARELDRMGGGLAVCDNDRTLATLPLPVAGLMTDIPADEVRRRLAAIRSAAAALGCSPDNPFMLLSFQALPVIPELKITDRGLVDVTRFAHVSLWY
ncbi:adenine deaminase [Thermodesulfobacteriota bacterium B35]